MRSVVLIAAALLAGCDVQVGEKGFSLDIAQGKATDEWVRTYELPAKGRLEVTNVNGTIELLPAQGRTIEVRAQREVKAHSEEGAREALQKLEMHEGVTPGRVAIGVTTGSAAESFVNMAQHSRV